MVNTSSPFVDSKPVPVVDPTSSPFVDSTPESEGVEKLSAKDFVTELRTRFGIETKKGVRNENLRRIEKWPANIQQLLLELKKPTNDNPTINNPVVQAIKDLNLKNFDDMMRVLIDILGKINFPYDIEGNICK
jgi:hypothetical protein